MSQVMKIFKLVILIAAMGAFGLFAVKNNGPVPINLEPFAQTLPIPVFMFFLIAFILGAAVASCFFMTDFVKARWELKKLRKERKDSIVDPNYSQSSYPVEDVSSEADKEDAKV